MPALTRVALIGGNEMLRAARRVAVEESQNFKVVLDADGFGLSPADVLEYNFDVAVLDQRLPNFSAFDFVRAMQSLARINGVEIGRVLISATYTDTALRITAIESGAIDCVFVESGIDEFVRSVALCRDVDTDYAIRELLPEIPSGQITGEEFAKASVAIDSLEPKEQAILENFCLLKSDAQIAQVVQVPKLKVRLTIAKVQNLLLLNTRSQLLLKLHQFGALTL